MKLIPFIEPLFKMVVLDNKERFGYITKATVCLFWFSDKVKSKVQAAVSAYKSKCFSDIMQLSDIENELYLTYCNAVLQFDCKTETNFISYLHKAFEFRINRLAMSFNSETSNTTFLSSEPKSKGDDSYNVLSLLQHRKELFTTNEQNEIDSFLAGEIKKISVSLKQKIFALLNKDIEAKQKDVLDISKSKPIKLNYMNVYTYTSTAHKDINTNTVFVTTDGIVLETDNLSEADFSLQEGVEYTITIKKVVPQQRKENQPKKFVVPINQIELLF